MKNMQGGNKLAVDEFENNLSLLNMMLEREGYSESKIDECIEKIRLIGYQLDDEMADRLRKRIMSNHQVVLDLGSMLRDNQDPWFRCRISSIDNKFSKRNLKYLLEERNLPQDVVAQMDEITSDIMDGLGDPSNPGFRRVGLVMGDVQSGKTNTYTNLCCKAADVGYRVIILLTGTIEVLRKQTQHRLDMGFVGRDSSKLLSNDPHQSIIGVGKYDYVPCEVLTSTAGDFTTSKANAHGIPINDTAYPVLLVVKKNYRVLETIYTWFQNNSNNGVITSPLLLIDDEADNASVNTSSDPEKATKINGSIRNILKLFYSSTYVGFTATPYANIFINSDNDDDLYPKNFIYCLNSPSNYVGPSSLYSEYGSNRWMLKEIYVDEEKKCGLPEIPYKHSKEFKIETLPESLKEAINCFILTCVVRIMRGGAQHHMSMLVNLSRYTAVQDSARDKIIEYMFKIKNSIDAYSKLPATESLCNEDIFYLKTVWDNNYGPKSNNNLGYDWMKIQMNLDLAVKPIVIRSINQKNDAKTLDYTSYPDGLRIIAVGGNSLSRGLTLEGLCISYFYRRSQSYDTLMQMGRWFGYRDDYKDLCRVWMTSESIDWYEGISAATEELKHDFQLMNRLDRTPKDFGLRVKNDISGLIPTARNKMQYAGEDNVISKSLNGVPVWTSKVFVDVESVEKNTDAVKTLITKLQATITPYQNPKTGNNVWRNVDSKDVISFLSKYSTPPEDIVFNVSSIINMIESNGDEIRWDVAIQHGSDKLVYSPLEELNLRINVVPRNSYKICHDSVIRFNHNGLMTPANMMEGLFDINGEYDDALRIKLEQEYTPDEKSKKNNSAKDGKVHYPAKTYLRTNKRRPLLLIYPLNLGVAEQGKEDTSDKEKERERQRAVVANLAGRFPIGVALGFPQYYEDSSDKGFIIKYRTSTVYQKMGGNDDLDEEEE